MKITTLKIRLPKQKWLFVAAALMLAVTAITPLGTQKVDAAGQLTRRSVSINDSRFSQAGVTYVFTFRPVTLTGEIEGIKIQACTTALGGCSVPTTFTFAPSTYGSQSGWDQAVNFAKDGTGANDCTPAAGVLCLNRTTAGNETSNVDRVVTINSVTNASDTGSNNTENVFLRITLYALNTYTVGSVVDTGTVVTAMVNQLSVQATVEETLTFCLYTGANCGAGGSSVDLGVQTTASTDTDSTAKIDISANSNNGISVGYYSSQTLTSGSNTIDSATAAGETDDPGADEMFGLCARESGAGVVMPVAPYNTACTDDATSNDTYAFDATSTFDQIASSAGASDLSVLTLQFGVDITVTTESGIYTTTARFVAVPTY